MSNQEIQIPKLFLNADVEESVTPSVLSGKKRPNTQTLAADLCNSQFLKMSCVGTDGKTPRSISITASENKVLRIPDSGLMFKQQRSLQDMLSDIYEDPNGFEEFIQDIRSEMKPHTDVVPSPFDSRCGCLNDYDVDESVIVGQGRFSSVYFATRKRDMMPCALKKINCNPSDIAIGEGSNIGGGGSKESISPEKCLKEVGLLRSLDHPNIIKYLDSFLYESELYIILEWAGKGDLRELISEQKKTGYHFSELKVWTHFSQCCEAIGHMHDKRIIHRDIKPTNVFVMEDGSLKLGDLGLGRYLDLQSILAFSQVGTPLYMSPEVLRGEGHHFASDIWSLGCLLYELATLKSPFQEKGLTMDRLFLKIVKGDYRKNCDSFSSGRVSRVVESLLNTDPKERPDIHWVADTSLLARKLLSEKDMSRLPSGLPGSAAMKEEESASSQYHGTTTLLSDHSPSKIKQQVTSHTIHEESSMSSEMISPHGAEMLRGVGGLGGLDKKAVIDPLEEFAPSSRGPSMPRIEESLSTEEILKPRLEDEKEVDVISTYSMYNEEEVNLMNELLEDEPHIIDNTKIIDNEMKKNQSHENTNSHKSHKNAAANAIYPSDDFEDNGPSEDSDLVETSAGNSQGSNNPKELKLNKKSSFNKGASPQRDNQSSDKLTQSMSGLDGLESRLQQCLLRVERENGEIETDVVLSSKNRPNSSPPSHLMSPSSSRRIIKLVSGLMNRKNSCKVHIDDNLDSSQPEK